MLETYDGYMRGEGGVGCMSCILVITGSLVIMGNIR